MKRLIIILLFITNPLQAEKIEQISWFNLQEILEDDRLTYKIIKSCVSMNSAVTELIKEEHPDLAKEFFETANYLYPFGILVLKKIKKNIIINFFIKNFLIFITRILYIQDRSYCFQMQTCHVSRIIFPVLCCFLCNFVTCYI